MQEIREYVKIKKQELKQEIASHESKLKAIVVRVGDNPASVRYTRNKIKDCLEVGIAAELLSFPDSISEDDLLVQIDKLNADDTVTGYLVQLPLPPHIDGEKIKLAISPNKDLDGFHPLSRTTPATPLGIYLYLKDMNYDFAGKNAVVIGRSDIVGKPMAKLLLQESMNVTVIHSKTSETDKTNYIKNADLIIVATGHINTLTKDYEYKQSAVVFDVGINTDANGKLVGDCEPNLPVAFQSPVPGGVGLLTRLAVIHNLLYLEKTYNIL
jgi:methylenetetrahydrofolate dehydrogenase (NADP+)/methenyltetrahydrofolate cyclohydrolase